MGYNINTTVHARPYSRDGGRTAVCRHNLFNDHSPYLDNGLSGILF